MNDDQKTLTMHADAAALMLAAADDREAFAAMLLQLSFKEARDLLLATAEVGATMISLGEAHPLTTPRQILAALITSCRDGNL